MSEWWTYTLSDLILFSSHAYYRLFELYNAAIWPAQVLALALGLAVLAISRRGRPGSGRWIAAVLALGWLWVGLAFHGLRYSRLNTAAPYFGWAFCLEAALLVVVGVVLGRASLGWPGDLAGRVGLAMYLVALLGLPLVSPLLGRGVRSAEIFGLAPDPTAIGTLGLLLAGKFRPRWLLMVLPVSWCVVTGAILWALGSRDFWVAPLAAVVASVLAMRQHARE